MSNCIFKTVARMKISDLQALDDSDLQELLNNLREEMKTVHRAVNWVEAIIKLKNNEVTS